MKDALRHCVGSDPGSKYQASSRKTTSCPFDILCAGLENEKSSYFKPGTLKQELIKG